MWIVLGDAELGMGWEWAGNGLGMGWEWAGNGDEVFLFWPKMA